jgi:nucleoside-diphosphate-sugar epimerase
MKILVTGATGFTGKHVVRLLLEASHDVSCLVRPTSKRTAVSLPGIKFVSGDLDDGALLETAFRGQEVLINVAPLVGSKDGTNDETFGRRARSIVRACRAVGIKRAIFVSSTSIFTTIDAVSKRAKLAAEAEVLDSSLAYTILRPTMIYGGVDDRNMIRLIRFLRRYPVIAVPGNGKSRQQPIHVEDLAGAIVDCLLTETTIRKAYNVSGAQPITFNEVVASACQSLGVRRMIVHIPLRPALWAGKLLPWVQKKPWIKEERLLRLNEDKCFDHSDATRDFGFTPRHFAEGIRQEVLSELGGPFLQSP